MQCTTMDGNETTRAAAEAADAAGHRWLVRTLLIACIAGGTWLAAQDVGFTALGTLLR